MSSWWKQIKRIIEFGRGVSVYDVEKLFHAVEEAQEILESLANRHATSADLNRFQQRAREWLTKLQDGNL